MSYKTHYFNCAIIYNWNQMPLKFLSSVIFIQKKSIVFIFLSHSSEIMLPFLLFPLQTKVQSARDRTLNESLKHKQEKGHFRVVFDLPFKTSFCANISIWKWVWFPWKWKRRWRMVCTNTCFHTEARNNLEMAYCALAQSHASTYQ